MSVVLSNCTTPRTSASHGRIVTENSALSAALQENSDVVATSSAPSVSVQSSALDVVTSSANSNNAYTNPSQTSVTHSSDVQNTVNKSRLSLHSKENTQTEHLSIPNTPINASSPDQVEHNTEDNNEKLAVKPETSIQISDNPVATPHSNRYKYQSLKSKENSRIQKQVSYVKDGGTFCSGNGKAPSGLKNKSDLQADSNTNNSANVNVIDQPEIENTTLQQRENFILHATADRKNSLYANLPHEPSLIASQLTRLSINSTYDRVSRDRVPFSLDDSVKSVPPLDLKELTKDDFSDGSQVSTPTAPQDSPCSDVIVDQNLHASDRKTALTHFSPHSQYQTGRKTYEVENPVLSNHLPYIKSSADTFRPEGAEAQDQATFREQQGPDHLEPHASDLADDLNIPFPFDTQAQSVPSPTRQPPSPPVQTTPPHPQEPATSLRSSQVYTVTNPQVQRAQSRQISSTSAQRDKQQVNFDAEETNKAQSRIDRAPTPYIASPTRGDVPSDWDSPKPDQDRPLSSQASRRSLPPQHPPIDTLHTPKSGTRRNNEDTQSIKRVYVESPSFTREEEEEYRFVSSRLDDIDDRNQHTFRGMDSSSRGYRADDQYGDRRTNDRNINAYDRRGNDRNDFDRRPNDRDRNDYDRRPNDRDRNDYDRRPNDRNDHDRRGPSDYDQRPKRDNDRRDQYDKRDNDRYDRYEDRNKRENDKRYEDRSRMHDKESLRDRYEDRNLEMNGYSDYNERNPRQRGNDQREREYDDRSKYKPDDRYDSLRHERDEFNRENYREDEPNVRGYQKQNTEIEDQELRKEKEYQKDLKKRIESNLKGREDRYGGRADYDKENDFPSDSLEYPEDRGGYTRDSLEYNYNDQQQDWDNPPQNPYQDEQYYQQGLMKQDSKPDFYDPEDAERMEIVNPKAPKYDYVEKNKQDYGKAQARSYRELVQKKREEEEKLDHVFITPKVPSNAKKKAQPQKSQSAQPQHMGYQLPEQYPMGFKPSSAEEVWAKRAQMLSSKKESAQSNKPGKASASNSKAQRWNSNPHVKHAFNFEAPPPLPQSGQPYRAPGSYQQPDSREKGYSQQAGYGTPTRQLQPLDNKPAAPVSTEFIPTAVNPASPFRRHMELKPISQEIMTEDGQRISVDINLRLISPPPGQSGPSSPHHQQQLALVPVQETQPPIDQHGIGMPYQMPDMYGGNYDNRYGYAEEIGQYGDVGAGVMDVRAGGLTAEEIALADPTGYSKRYQPGSVSFKDDQTSNSELWPMPYVYEQKTLEEGYASLYQKMKTKDPSEHPWYKVYNIDDYKKMQREVRLNRGTLGPDLDTESYKDKMEKRHKQFEYARMVMEKNRQELGSKKPPKFPRQPEKVGEEGVKRKTALEYAKNVPKPQVKMRPNQYNSYEVAAQLAPGTSSKPRSQMKPSPTMPTQTVDVIDIRTLEQRHLQERKNTDKIRQNMESVLSQKAH